MDIKTRVIGGLTPFVTVAYALLIIPNILKMGGIIGTVILATVVEFSTFDVYYGSIIYIKIHFNAGINNIRI